MKIFQKAQIDLPVDYDKEEFARMLQEQREEFVAKNAETTDLIKEIRNLADIKAVMRELVESTKGQTAILERLVIGLNNQQKDSRMADSSRVAEVKTVATQVFPKSITYMVATITLLSFMAFGLYVYNSFVAKKHLCIFVKTVFPFLMQNSFLIYDSKYIPLSFLPNAVFYQK